MTTRAPHAARSRARSPCRPRAACRAAPRASSNARRAIRSTWSGWYSHVSKTRAVLARAARAVVEAADELAHDQQVDARRRPPGAGSRRRRAPCAARSAPARGAPRRRPTAARRPRRAAPRRRRGTPRGSSGGQRLAERVDRGAAERVLLDVDLERQRLEHADGLAITSGPIPSPGRQHDRLLAMELLRVSSSTWWKSAATPLGESGPPVRRLQPDDKRLLARRVAQRHPLGALVLVQPRARARAAG